MGEGASGPFAVIPATEGSPESFRKKDAGQAGMTRYGAILDALRLPG
jgi:hypothetical protein